MSAHTPLHGKSRAPHRGPRRWDQVMHQLLERLEPRWLFNTYIVTTTTDNLVLPPPGSLRQAIISANVNPGQDTISFSISGGGKQAISLVGALPNITDSVIIDATTQSGYSGAPLVRIDGTTAPATNRAFGLYFQNVGNNTVKGLAFTGWDTGVEFDNSGGGVGNNTFTGNYIGVSTDGKSAFGSKYTGLYLYHSSSNTISNNVISSNGGNGVEISGADANSNIVAGNYIGLASNGTTALGNGGNGVGIYGGANNRIGTNGDNVNDAAERNIISANALNGVQISGAGANANVVAGNFIGTDATGSVMLANLNSAINVFGGASNNIISKENPNISVTVGPAGSINFTDVQDLANLTLNDGTASVLTSTRKTLSVGGLSISGNGLLDLGNNDLLVDNTLTPFNTILNYWKSGYNYQSNLGYGLWDGSSGITSSVARASVVNGDFRVSVGYVDGAIQNDPNIGNLQNVGFPFALPTNRIYVSPRLYGDLNFDGHVDGNDIGVIVGLGYFGGNSAPHGYIDGDLNGDGVVDGNDIGIIVGAGTFNNGFYGPVVGSPSKITATTASAAQAPPLLPVPQAPSAAIEPALFSPSLPGRHSARRHPFASVLINDLSWS